MLVDPDYMLVGRAEPRPTNPAEVLVDWFKVGKACTAGLDSITA